jgi:phosphoglycolate phosphatase
MPKRFDLLVFDWDGTLMDSAACIAAALQGACRDLGHPVPSERDARYVIGLGLHDALGHVLPGVRVSDYAAVVERYRHHFLLGDQSTTLFAGVAEMIRQLRDAGHLLAIATGKSRRGLDRALAASHLMDCFDVTRCADESESKPHPGMLQWIMSELHVSPSRTLMIGDTTHDMAMAHAAGVTRLAVAHGAHDRAALLQHEPVACLSDCIELGTWLARNA